jgi:hypothetical protein
VEVLPREGNANRKTIFRKNRIDQRMPLKFCHELCFSLPKVSLHPKLVGDGQDKSQMVAQSLSGLI